MASKNGTESGTDNHRALGRAQQAALKAAVALLVPKEKLPFVRDDWRARISPLVVDAIDLELSSEEAGLCVQLATRYAEGLAADKKAPRIKQTLRNFREISVLSHQLAQRLSTLSAEEAFFLNTIYGVPSNVFARLSKLMRALPSLPRGRDEDRLAPMLDAFGDYVALRRETLVRKLGKLGKGRIDPGGSNNNVWRRLIGSPADLLIREVWTLFEDLDQLPANSSEDGVLNIFLGHIHTIATGKPPKNFHAQILKHIKLMNQNARQRAPKSN